jgi:hypothetical protein
VSDVTPAKRDIAMVFQRYALYPHMTAFDFKGFEGPRRAWPAFQRRRKSMTIQTIPLQSIQPTQGNPRSVIEGAALEGLAASIRQDGLLQNLVVSRSKGRRYRIVSGERRYCALKLLQERGEIAGDYPVPVEIRNNRSG